MPRRTAEWALDDWLVSVICSTGGVPSHAMNLAARRASSFVRLRLAEDVRRLMADAGVSTRALAAEAGLDRGHVARIVRGECRPSIETYARLTAALGADLSARVYPNTGPSIRDRHQGRISEWLLSVIHPRWVPSSEVIVRQPARGAIDLVLFEPRERVVVATEIESELRRLEQLIRWSREKADALPSSRVWPDDTAEPPTVSQLLIVRRTRATRRVALEFSRQLAVAYPAHPDDAVAALTQTRRWPGPALVWIAMERDRPRFVAGR